MSISSLMSVDAFDYLLSEYAVATRLDYIAWEINSSLREAEDKKKNLYYKVIGAYQALFEENTKLLEENKQLREKLLSLGISLE